MRRREGHDDLVRPPAAPSGGLPVGGFVEHRVPLGVQVVAQAEWDRRHSVFAAAALAWALHAAGRDAGALLVITVGLGLALRNLDGPV